MAITMGDECADVKFVPAVVECQWGAVPWTDRFVRCGVNGSTSSSIFLDIREYLQVFKVGFAVVVADQFFKFFDLIHPRLKKENFSTKFNHPFKHWVIF
jgi:hypothetical protein